MDPCPPRALRAIGLTLSLLYAAAIVRVYVRQPATLPEVAGSLTASVGVYRVDQARFDAGPPVLPRGQVPRGARRLCTGRSGAAGSERAVLHRRTATCARAGAASTTTPTLYRAGKATLDHAREIAPHGTILVDDPALRLHSAEELEAEFDRGLTHGVSDLNPMRLLRERP